METIDKPTIFIVGQTATGKTGLSIRLAKKYGGEIICADSRTIYKHMDIGTAKPTLKEQSGVIHYGLDMMEPNEFYSAAEFKKYAKEKIDIIQHDQKIPFIVGGTGLYLDGVIYNFSFPLHMNIEQKQKMEQTNIKDLQSQAKQLGIEEDEINFKNPRHLSSAIARGSVIKQPKIKPDNYLILGLGLDKEELDRRIEDRVELMLSEGLIDEVVELTAQYGDDAPGLQAPAYKVFIKYSQNKISYSEARDQLITADKQLAKRQKTWFKRNKDIIWVKNFIEADIEVENFISKFGTMSK